MDSILSVVCFVRACKLTEELPFVLRIGFSLSPLCLACWLKIYLLVKMLSQAGKTPQCYGL